MTTFEKELWRNLYSLVGLGSQKHTSMEVEKDINKTIKFIDTNYLPISHIKKVVEEIEKLPTYEQPKVKWLNEEERKKLDMVFKQDVIHLLKRLEMK